MPEELKQIETMTLTDFIDQEMTKLREDAIEMLHSSTDEVMNDMPEILSKTSTLIILQEIAYRIEYGFITEMGNKSLKEHLVKP